MRLRYLLAGVGAMMAARTTAFAVTRPPCGRPKIAAVCGPGSVNKAANFACVGPLAA
jgi:hypothetical protein